MKSDNAQIHPNSLVVSGYDVSGMVTSDNDPLPDVHFVAFTGLDQKVVSSIFLSIRNTSLLNVFDGRFFDRQEIINPRFDVKINCKNILAYS